MGRRGKPKRKWKGLLPAVTVTLTGLPFAVWSPPALAVFPPVFPISPPVTVVPPVAPPPVVSVPPVSPPPMVPPVSPPPVIVPPVSPPPIVVPPVSPPPITTTPEPTSLALGAIGLAAAAAYRLRRRADKPAE